ncbi:MAG: HNH endonuclease [Pseudomonadota bacterium]
MSEYAIIVQNDESKWDDVKGDLYNYPNTYKSILTKGCKVIYYKGKIKDKAYLPFRLSPESHYFGIGVVGEAIWDPESNKKDLYCEILEYREFDEAVPIKINDEYLEEIPESKKSNYWRFGVREISKKTYDLILSNTSLKNYSISLPKEHGELESYGIVEGNKKQRYTSYYERNPFYRNKAIEIHGLTCMGCRFNFEEVYGPIGRGFIHVHHNKPVSESGPTRINPRTDMSVLCPNCHSMTHRNKNHTLTVEELKKMIYNKLLKPTPKRGAV